MCSSCDAHFVRRLLKSLLLNLRIRQPFLSDILPMGDIFLIIGFVKFFAGIPDSTLQYDSAFETDNPSWSSMRQDTLSLDTPSTDRNLKNNLISEAELLTNSTDLPCSPT